MTTLTKLDPKTIAKKLREGDAVLIDIRERDEYVREHITGSVSFPLSALDKGELTIDAGAHAVFHCRSGMRTDANCARLAAHVDGEAFVLDGGLEAWKQTGLPTTINTSVPIEINRQVQITAGALILSGIVASVALHPGFAAVSAIVGAGLIFAGISGWCGMAHILAMAPWNRRPAAH